MTRFTSPKYLFSVLDSGSTVALTAPLVLDARVLIGFALSPEESHSVDLGLNEFIALCPSLYGRVKTPRVFHGLKRIWEFLDSRGLRTNKETDNLADKDKIEDIKLMAYLLDPDSGREVESGKYRVQEGLTLVHLCSRYLEEEYPHRNTAIYEGEPQETLSQILAYDAGLIRRLADRLPTESLHEEVDTVSTKAEAGLYSEAVDIEEQARQAQPLKDGENLLPVVPGAPTFGKQTKEQKP